MIRGIDISQWQDPKAMNYDVLAKNIDFAILRVGYTGYGTGQSLHPDVAFNRHYDELKKRNVPVGAYWYSCATTPELARKESDMMMNLVSGLTFEYPLYVDTEDSYHQAKISRDALTDTIIAFCQNLERRGYYAGIYASHSWFLEQLNLSRLGAFDLWVASWGAKVNPMPNLAGLWQFSSTGQLPGYAGNLDLNQSLKNYRDIIKNAGLNGFKKPTPKPPEPETVTITATATIPKADADAMKRILKLLGFGVD